MAVLTRQRAVAVTALVALLATAGCTDDAPETPSAAAPTSAAASASASAAPVDTSCRPRESLRPTGDLPRPGAMPAGSYMAAIAAQGHLRVGTSQDTLLFSSRNPFTGVIEGFDIDMARQVAQAIFGDPNKIQIVVTPNAERVDYTVKGTVDLVAHTMTMNCERWSRVDFSTVYYDAGQRILVSTDSTVKSVADLSGKRVCAAAGSTSLDNLALINPAARIVPEPTQAECLVALQRNQIEAISTDDTILAGLAKQDPYTKIVGDKFTQEPYGLAIAKTHPEFVRFVNAVLARNRADGTWQRTYRTWLGGSGATPQPPVAEYKD